MESYNQSVVDSLGIPFYPVQDNHSLSKRAGTLRGLHFQLPPAAQGKWVRVLRGSMYDVVVDIRTGSATYRQWKGFHLSAENRYQLFVPKGFAHGFCTLEDNTEVMYKVDSFYSPQHDTGILWSDPHLGITWPEGEKIVSTKDAGLPTLAEFIVQGGFTERER
jgi:dTDP-4-dehydrorhamnose 3,5-epimerase